MCWFSNDRLSGLRINNLEDVLSFDCTSFRSDPKVREVAQCGRGVNYLMNDNIDRIPIISIKRPVTETDVVISILVSAQINCLDAAGLEIVSCQMLIGTGPFLVLIFVGEREAGGAGIFSPVLTLIEAHGWLPVCWRGIRAWRRIVNSIRRQKRASPMSAKPTRIRTTYVILASD